MELEDIIGMTPTTPPLYRGAGTSVQGITDTKEMRARADLDWEPKLISLFGAAGGASFVEIPRLAIWRDDMIGDTAGFLDTCTSSYNPHRNEDLINTMQTFCDSIGAEITHLGHFGHGARIWAGADAHLMRDPKPGDTFALRFMIRSGHEVGVSTQVSVQSVRLVCSNGMTITQNGRSWRITHSAKFGRDAQLEARRFLSAATELFDKHIEQLGQLYATPLTPTVRRLILVNLFTSRETWDELFDRVRLERQADLKLGAETLEAMLALDEAGKIPWTDLIDRSRLVYDITEATRNQPGRALAQGSMAELLNGVTYWNQHKRGSGATAAEQSLYGTGQRTNQAVQDALFDVLPAVQQVMGVRQ